MAPLEDHRQSCGEEWTGCSRPVVLRALGFGALGLLRLRLGLSGLRDSVVPKRITP